MLRPASLALASVLALGAFTSAAFAEPLVLSDIQMNTITAGQITQSNTSEVNVTQSNTSNVSMTADASVSQSKSIEGTSASFISIMPSARGPMAMTAVSIVLTCESIP